MNNISLRQKRILETIFPHGNEIDFEGKLQILKDALRLFPKKFENLFEKREELEQEKILNDLSL